MYPSKPRLSTQPELTVLPHAYRVLVCWCVGVLVCWCVCVFVCWCVGVLVCWFVGVLVCWFVGVWLLYDASMCGVSTQPKLTVLPHAYWVLVCWCHHHHHYAAVMSRVWAKASACRLQISLVCAVLWQIVSLQYLCRSSLHRLAGLPCRMFLSYGLQVVTCEVHRSSLRRLICPAQDHFIFLTVLIISMNVVLSLTQILVFDVEHTFFHFDLCGRKFVLCLFGQCSGFCTICYS